MLKSKSIWLGKIGNIAIDPPFPGAEKSGSIEFVTIRRCIYVFLAFLWASAPVLACLPTPAMTDAEMACCKKMAGNCDMGAGNHSCCKDTLKQAQAVTAVVRTVQAQVTPAVIVVSQIFIDPSLDDGRENLHATLPAIAISPPDLFSILRI